MENLVFKIGKLAIIPAALVAVALYAQGYIAAQAFWSSQGLLAPSHDFAEYVERGGALWIDGILALAQLLNSFLHFQPWWCGLTIYGAIAFCLVAAVGTAAGARWAAWLSFGLYACSWLTLVGSVTASVRQLSLAGDDEGRLRLVFGTGVLGLFVGGILLRAIPRALTSMRYRFVNEHFGEESVRGFYQSMGVSAFYGAVAWLVIIWPATYGHLKRNIKTSPVKLIFNSEAPDLLRKAFSLADVHLVSRSDERLLFVVGKDRRYWEVPADQVVCIQYIDSAPSFTVPAPRSSQNLVKLLAPVTIPLATTDALLSPVGSRRPGNVAARWRASENGIDRYRLTVERRDGSRLFQKEYDKDVREVHVVELTTEDLNGSSWRLECSVNQNWRPLGRESISVLEKETIVSSGDAVREIDQLDLLPATARLQIKFWELLSRDDKEGAKDVATCFLGIDTSEKTWAETLLIVRAHMEKCRSELMESYEALEGHATSGQSVDEAALERLENAASNSLEFSWASELVDARSAAWAARAGFSSTSLGQKAEEFRHAATMLDRIERRIQDRTTNR